jgi:hypothetical protein
MVSGSTTWETGKSDWTEKKSTDDCKPEIEYVLRHYQSLQRNHDCGLFIRYLQGMLLLQSGLGTPVSRSEVKNRCRASLHNNWSSYLTGLCI